MSTDSNSGVQTSKVANFFSMNAWWYTSAALMLFVLIGIIAIFLLPTDDTTAGTQPNTAPAVPPAPLSSSAPTPQPTAATGWDDLGCNGTRGSTDIPTMPPKATWEPLGPFSVPTSRKYGPTETTGVVRQCFQHTPTGAVFAAINLPFAIGAASPSDYEQVVAERMTPGGLREEMLANGQESEPGQAFSIAAFRVESCAPERCNVALVMSSGAQLLKVSSPMVWSDGDWKADGADMGSTPSVIESVPAGFASFEPGM